MAKFCTECGKPLVDGKPCACSEKEEILEQESLEEEKETKREVKKVVDEEENSEPSQIGNMIGDLTSMIKGMLKKPATTIEKYAGIEYFNTAIVSIIVNAILFGGTVHVFIDNCLKKCGYSLKNAQVLIQQLTEELSTIGITISVDTNIWFKGALAMGIASVVMIGIMYLMHTQVFKKKLNIKKIVVMIGVCETFLSVGYLLTIISSYLNAILAVAIFAIFVLIFFVHVHQGYLQISKTEQDKSIYSYIAGILIPVIGFIVVLVIALIISVIILGFVTYTSNAAMGS